MSVSCWQRTEKTPFLPEYATILSIAGPNLAKKRGVRGRVRQNHHISYENPEWIVPIYKGEHELLTKMNLYSRKDLSQGFIVSMLDFIGKNFGRATKLGEEIKR